MGRRRGDDPEGGDRRSRRQDYNVERPADKGVTGLSAMKEVELQAACLEKAISYDTKEIRGHLMRKLRVHHQLTEDQQYLHAES